MATLSVIVPATNSPATLEACLAAIAAAEQPPEEVIVVDDAEATGAAAARNVGVARSTGAILMFVDADVTVHPDVFERVRAAFAEDASLDAVFGSYDDDPAARDAVSGFRNLLHHHVHHQAGGEARTFWAGLGAIRRETFEQLGGFVDHPIEDIELGMRLHARGGRLWLDPAIQGTHLKRWSVAGMIRTDLLVRGAPWVELLLRHRAPAKGLNLGWSHRLSALASLALVSLVLVAAASLALAPAVALAAGATALGALGALVALNASFYRLIARRRGVAQAALGVLLHAVHHLVAVAALVLGVILYLRQEPRQQAPPETSAVPVESSTA